jgi:hypothetical protein
MPVARAEEYSSAMASLVWAKEVWTFFQTSSGSMKGL